MCVCVTIELITVLITSPPTDLQIRVVVVGCPVSEKYYYICTNLTIVNRPVTRPVNRPVNRPVTRPVNRPGNRPVNRSVNKPVYRPVNRPVNRPVVEVVVVGGPVSE